MSFGVIVTFETLKQVLDNMNYTHPKKTMFENIKSLKVEPFENVDDDDFVNYYDVAKYASEVLKRKVVVRQEKFIVKGTSEEMTKLCQQFKLGRPGIIV